jgi:hypothetical protein
MGILLFLDAGISLSVVLVGCYHSRSGLESSVFLVCALEFQKCETI